jgi:hypothetical protein
MHAPLPQLPPCAFMVWCLITAETSPFTQYCIMLVCHTHTRLCLCIGIVSAIFLKKEKSSRTLKSDPKFDWRGGVLIIQIPEEKVPECHSGFLPSE